MAGHEFPVLLEHVGEGVVGQEIRTDTTGLPNVNVNIVYPQRLDSKPRLNRVIGERLEVTAYTPDGLTQGSNEFAGGYHLTYIEPDGVTARRIGIIARREFVGHMYTGSGENVGFQNYPTHQDILIASDTVAFREGEDGDFKYRVQVYSQLGLLLPFQFDGAYPLTQGVEKEIETAVGDLNAKALAMLGLLRTPFTINDPRYPEPLKTVITLDEDMRIGQVQIVLPSADAKFSIVIPGKTQSLVDKRILVPGHDGEYGRLKNFHGGGWAPIEPGFMNG